jgi:hypothetical protein
MTGGIHDRKFPVFQAVLAIFLFTIAPVWAQEAGPDRYGDPEVIWEPTVKEETVAPPEPEMKTEIAPPEPAATAMESSGLPVDEEVRAILASVRPGDPYPKQYAQMLALGEPAVPTLIRVFNDSTSVWQTRWFAAMALGRIGGSPAREALEVAVTDPLFLIRLAAVQSLGNLGDPISAPALRKALADKAMVVRASAADALGQIKDREAVPLMEKELFESRNFYRGRSLWARPHIVDALVEIGSESCVPTLVRLLKDTDPEMRSKSCDALARLVSDPPPPATGAVSCETRWQTWYQRSR